MKNNIPLPLVRRCITGRTQGFTLLEIIIATTILVIIMGTATPLIINDYVTYRMITAQQDLVSVLRKAQSLAMSNQYESPFGVQVASSSYIIFRGASYASRIVAFDEDVPYSGAIATSGATEIVFAQLSGRPNTTGTISLVSGDLNKVVTVNEEGRINW
jgi:prepilin-type N-terminal cleavage/methylation domain-containing protein